MCVVRCNSVKKEMAEEADQRGKWQPRHDTTKGFCSHYHAVAVLMNMLGREFREKKEKERVVVVVVVVVEV